MTSRQTERGNHFPAMMDQSLTGRRGIGSRRMSRWKLDQPQFHTGPGDCCGIRYR
jgi:hypothetical protein